MPEILPDPIIQTAPVTLHILPDEFTVCQVAGLSGICFEEEFVFIAKTDDELSVVCRTAAVPTRIIAREDDWSAIKIRGVLDFSLCGILAGIASILADARISIFAVSTYNTDYILLKNKNLRAAEKVLHDNGYTFN